MFNFYKFRHRPDIIKSLTGLTLGQFARLQSRYDELRRAGFGIQRKTSRLRAVGGGRRGILPNSGDQILFILMYFRQYPTQEFMGIIWDMSQPQVCDRVKFLAEIVSEALNKELVLPQRPPSHGEFIIRAIPGLSYIIDGFERPRTRPTNSELQTEVYSGKKKRHCIKNNMVTDLKTKKIVAIGRTCPGKMHDKAMADQDKFVFPESSMLTQDTGYQGYIARGALHRQPAKKPKGKELDDWTKFSNRTISMERVAVEHSIRGLKIYRISKDTFRNTRKGFDDLTVGISAGLYNLRLAS